MVSRNRPHAISRLFSGSSDDVLFFFFLDDDAWCHHQHDAFRFTSNPTVLEQAADVWNLVQNRNTVHLAAFSQTLDTAQKNCTAVWNADRG